MFQLLIINPVLITKKDYDGLEDQNNETQPTTQPPKAKKALKVE